MITLASRLWWRRYLSRNARPWKELDEFASLTPGRQRMILAQKLHEQIRYFGTREDALPEWREAAKINEASELWKVWPSLPIIGKKTLQTLFHPAEMQKHFNLQGQPGSTGGSTGEPTPFFHDWPMLFASVGADIYTRLHMGWQPGMPTVSVWGSDRDIGKDISLGLRLHYRLLNEFNVDGYELHRGTVERTIGLIRAHKPIAMFGFTSMLEYIARETLHMGAKVPQGAVSTAWNGGEMLFDSQVEVFKKAFGVPILNRYGGRELSTMAFQPAENVPLKILRPWLFMEVVNSRGEVAVPGETGRLICTSTICRGTPFLRYEIEDAGMFVAEHATEAGVTALSELHGRSAGLLELANGKQINCLYWNHLFKEFAEVQQFQVVLGSEGNVRLLLKGSGFAPPREQQLRSTVGNFLGHLPLELRWVDQIPRTSRGKLMQVVRE